MREEILRMEHINKRVGDLYILKDFKLNIFKGEIVGIAGLSGTGKTTITNILSGFDKNYEGKIYFNDIDIRENYRFFKDSSIFCVHHNIRLVPKLSIAENIFVIRKNSYKKITLNKEAINKETIEILKEVDLNISPETKAEELSLFQQHLIVLSKALVERASLIIIDDIADFYTLREKNKFYGIIQKLNKRGISFIFQSHKGGDLFPIADRIIVLRDGSNIKTLYKGEYDKDRILSLMLGKEFINRNIKEDRKIGEEILRFTNVSIYDSLKDINFKLCQGEILGILDIENKSNNYIRDILIGENKITSGSIFLNGEKIQIKNIRNGIKKGIGYIPKDKIKNGIFINMSYYENLIFLRYKDMDNFFFKINNRILKYIKKEYGEKLEIDDTNYHNLRYFNVYMINKIVFNKWIIKNPKLLIIDSPYTMADIIDKEIADEYIEKISRMKIPIIIISSDIGEAFSVCSRILVFKSGSIKKEYSNEEILEKDPLSILDNF